VPSAATIPLELGLAEVMLQGVALHGELPLRPRQVEVRDELAIFDLELLNRDFEPGTLDPLERL
jgi:hypothetical protein